MTLNPKVNNVLSALLIAGIGFLLLNLTFLFDFLYQSIVRAMIVPFLQVDNPEMSLRWFPPLMHISFVVVILLISWFVFKSKLGDFYKATFMIVPLAVIFVTLGMFLSNFPAVLYLLCAMVFVALFSYLKKKKAYWLYYYSLVLISVVLTIFNLSGGEI